MASSSTEVPYNHSTENVLFGQNVIEKISDTCLGQDGKRYYQVKWRDSWEPEERLMAACEGALQTFWKEYYSNVEKEIRKQVVSASKVVIPAIPTKENPAQEIDIVVNTVPTNDLAIDIPDVDIGIKNETTVTQPAIVTLPQAIMSHNSIIETRDKRVVVESFPEQSSTVAYYAVQDNEDGENVEQEAVDIHELNGQAEILTQIINSSAAKWTDNKEVAANRQTLTSITADTLNTKNVSGPDSNSKFHCDICMKTFVSKRNVQRHMLSHTGEKPWMCEFCFKRFRQKPHLEQHVNIHKGIKNAVCSVCGKAFNHRSNLVTHMATHSNVRPHTCDVCGENFKLKHTLAKHMMVHTKQDIDKRHQCQICKRSFRDKSYLAEHETIHNKEKPWQCDICSKSFSFKRRYQMHLEVHQNKDGGEEFVCHLCPKKFKGKVYLQKHLERHENKRRRRKRKKSSKDADSEETQDDMGSDELPINNSEDDINLSMSEVDVKPEQELEEGEKVDDSQSDENSAIMQINESDPNMVVTSMLPMNTLNMEDATYVALAQLSQAAIDSAPMDESGNVILMSYDDIHKSMQELQTAQQADNTVVTQADSQFSTITENSEQTNFEHIQVITQPTSVHVVTDNGELRMIQVEESPVTSLAITE